MKRAKTLVVGGGVAANNRLREKFLQKTREEGIGCYFPSLGLCMDNAAMVAGLAYRLFKKGIVSNLNLNVDLQ
jgi:N6-L-threonylcarbamoyladenine synthase